MQLALETADLMTHSRQCQMCMLVYACSYVRQKPVRQSTTGITGVSEQSYLAVSSPQVHNFRANERMSTALPLVDPLGFPRAAAQVLPKGEAEQLLAQAGNMGRDRVVSVVVQSAPGADSSADSYGSGALVRLLSFRVPYSLPPCAP